MVEEGNKTSLSFPDFLFPLPVRCAEAAYLRGSCCGVSGAPQWAAPCSCHLRLRRPSSTEAGWRSLLLLLSPVPARAKVTLVPPDGKMTAAAVTTRARVKEHPVLSVFFLLIFISPSFSPRHHQPKCFWESIRLNSQRKKKKRRWRQHPKHMRLVWRCYWVSMVSWPLCDPDNCHDGSVGVDSLHSGTINDNSLVQLQGGDPSVSSLKTRNKSDSSTWAHLRQRDIPC